MARKAEKGITYYPMNTNFINNKKVKLMVAEFGSTLTWGCLLFLYSKIYEQNGYWLDWMNEDEKLIMSEESKIKVSTLNEFVAGCIRRSLFDKGLFDTFGILTSDRIQENYIEAKKRVTKFELIRQFLKCEHDVYINLKNVNIIDLNVNIISKNVDISTQKESEIQNKNESEIITPESRAQISSTHLNEFQLLTIDECRKRYDVENVNLRNDLGAYLHIKPDEVIILHNNFDLMLKTKEPEKQYNDYTRHFSNWARKLPPDELKQKIKPTQAVFMRPEQIKTDASKYEDYYWNPNLKKA